MAPRTLAVTVVLGTLLAGAYLAGRASSEEAPAPPPGLEEQMKEWAKLATPGKPHELLKTFEGAWVGRGGWTDGGFTSKFTENVTAKLEFGGRFLKVDSRMATEASGGIPSMSMTSTMFVGFDNAKQKYVQAMVGDMSTALGTSEGTYDEATKTLTMSGVEVLGPGKERKFRMLQKIVSKDEWAFELYFTGPDGKETKAGDAVYTRAP